MPQMYAKIVNTIKKNMLQIIFVISQVACEWVEISQNQYRPNTFRKGLVGVSPKMHYTNSSITNSHWHKAVIDRVPNLGNIYKIEPKLSEESSVSTNSQPISRNEVNLETKNRRISNDKWIMKQKDTDHTPVNLEESDDWIHLRIKAPSLNKDTIISTVNGKSKVEKSQFQTTSDNDQNYNNLSDTTTFKPDVNKLKIKDMKTETQQQKILNPEVIKTSISTHAKLPKSNSQINQFEFNQVDTDSKSHDFNHTNDGDKFQQEPFEEYVSVEANESNIKDEELKPDVQTSSINLLDKLLKFVKIIADTINKNKGRDFKSKVNYLEDLKNTVLVHIEDRIDRAWPDDVSEEGYSHEPRESRSVEARGHLEVPSSEGALMTISFLTFAVFLVKLVLQVIHTYKNKTMMVSPAVLTAVGRALYSINNRP